MSLDEGSLRKQIEKIKNDLMLLGDMRPGTLSQQEAKSSGTKYWQISYTHKMKSRTEYVRPYQVSRLKKEVLFYQRFRKLIQQWVDTSFEISRIVGKNAKAKPGS